MTQKEKGTNDIIIKASTWEQPNRNNRIYPKNMLEDYLLKNPLQNYYGTKGFLPEEKNISAESKKDDNRILLDELIYVNEGDIFIDNKNGTLVIFEKKDIFKQKVNKIKSLKIDTEVISISKYSRNKEEKNKKKKILIEKNIKKEKDLDYNTWGRYVYMPYISAYMATTISMDLISVQPMSNPTSSTFFYDCYVNSVTYNKLNNKLFSSNGFSCITDSAINNCYMDLKNAILYVYDGSNWIKHKILNFKIEIESNNNLKITLTNK
jgi:hypothetical protein